MSGAKKKAAQLGMPHGTAAGKLRKDAIAVIQNDELPLGYFVRHRCWGTTRDFNCTSFADAVKVMKGFISRY